MNIPKLKEETNEVEIEDAEGDCLKCSFNGDNCVVIDTSKYTYITLSYSNLLELEDLILEDEID